MRYTPEIITKLEKNEIFVFGSNEAGIHGAGAARLAKEKFGAIQWQGFGLQGSCFAIPTKDWEIETLPLEAIDFYVKRFLALADKSPKMTFLVTKIGCGLAGLSVHDIAPMFNWGGSMPSNIVLPKEFY